MTTFGSESLDVDLELLDPAVDLYALLAQRLGHRGDVAPVLPQERGLLEPPVKTDPITIKEN